MPLLGAVPVMLSAGERTTGKKRVRGAKTAYRDRLRAQIVLAAVRGHPNARIAAGLGISGPPVRSASGGAGSPPAAWTGWPTGPGPAGRGGSARRTGPR